MDTLLSWFQENERSKLANGAVSEAEALLKATRVNEHASTETGRRSNLLSNSQISPGHDMTFSSQDIHYPVTGAAKSSVKAKSGEHQLSVFAESPMSQYISLVSRPDQHTNLPANKSQIRPLPNHNMTSSSQDAHYAGIGGSEIGAKTKFVNVQLLPSSATRRHLSESISQVSQSDPFIHKRGLSQEEPDCFTQVSELETVVPLTSNASQRQSKRLRFVPRRLTDCSFPGTSENCAMRVESEHESAVNLDSSCPLWSQQSLLSSQAPSQAIQTKLSAGNFRKNPQSAKHLSPWPSQAFQTKISTDNLEKNPQGGKKLSPSKAFQAKFSRVNLKKNPCSGKKLSALQKSTDKATATKTANAAAQTVAGMSNQNEIKAPNKDVVTTSKQASSSLNNSQGPPRFSELLTQASQSKPNLPPKATRPSNLDIRKFTSKFLSDPAKSSETGITAQDDTRGATVLGDKAKLRKQILACLLEPGFEEFLAEVEKTWDEVQESVSDNLESQILGSLLEKGTECLLSDQSRRP